MATEKILVVEDQYIIGMEIKDRLETLGYDVPAMVVSGEDAIGKTKELRPDLILMDIQLDGKLDGIEAAEQITTEFEVPIIYLTAYSDYSTLERAKKNVDSFLCLHKPFEEKELLSTIKQALNPN
ncbi:response regulator [candidate division KSB1 bacterium]|nr:response regulator [candidate division KSB1 bacterium]